MDHHTMIHITVTSYFTEDVSEELVVKNEDVSSFDHFQYNEILKVNLCLLVFINPIETVKNYKNFANFMRLYYKVFQ